MIGSVINNNKTTIPIMPVRCTFCKSHLLISDSSIEFLWCGWRHSKYPHGVIAWKSETSGWWRKRMER